MREEIVYGGLPIPGTDGHVQDVGFNCFIDLYQVLEMIDTVNISH